MQKIINREFALFLMRQNRNLNGLLNIIDKEIMIAARLGCKAIRFSERDKTYIGHIYYEYALSPYEADDLFREFTLENILKHLRRNNFIVDYSFETRELIVRWAEKRILN